MAIWRERAPRSMLDGLVARCGDKEASVPDTGFIGWRGLELRHRRPERVTDLRTLAFCIGSIRSEE